MTKVFHPHTTQPHVPHRSPETISPTLIYTPVCSLQPGRLRSPLRVSTLLSVPSLKQNYFTNTKIQLSESSDVKVLPT